MMNLLKEKIICIADIGVGISGAETGARNWRRTQQNAAGSPATPAVTAKEALENSKKTFPELINPKIEDIIVKHMFPLNIAIPKYKETWVVTYMDKVCSLDILKHPKEYPKYLGLSRKGKK